MNWKEVLIAVACSNLATLDQQVMAAAVSWHGRGWGVAVVCVIENWLRPMLKLADLSLV